MKREKVTMRVKKRTVLAAAVILVTPFAAGCGLAGQIARRPGKKPPVQAEPGETQGTIPSGREPAPTRPASNATLAIERFAELYVNWSYQTLSGQERQLAAMSVGGARQAELQAAAQTARDTTLQRAGIFNRGTLVAVSPAIGGARGEYVVVTKEETGGDPEYAGLRAAFHVTLARVQAVMGGVVVSEWQPQT